MSFVKIFFKALFILVAAITILFMGSIGYLLTDHGQGMLQSRINQIFPGSVSWHLSNLSPFNGILELTDIQLTDDSGESVVNIKRLNLNLSMEALFSGMIVLHQLTVESPDILLKVDDTGQTNLNRAIGINPDKTKGEKVEPAAGLAALPVRIDLFEITQGRFQGNLYGPPSQGQDQVVLVEGILIRGDSIDLMTHSGSIRIDFDHGSLDAPYLKRTFDGLRLSSVLASNTLAPIELEVISEGAVLKASAIVKNCFAVPDFNLNARFSTNLDDFEKIIPGSDLPGGNLKLDLKVKGSGISLETVQSQISLDVHLTDLLIQPDASPVQVQMMADALVNPKEISFKKCEVFSGKNRVAIKGRYGFQDQEIAGIVSLLVPDLKEILNSLRISNEPISGRLAAELEARGSIRTPEITVSVEGSKLAYKDIPVGLLNLAGKLSSKGIMSIQKASLKNDGFELKADGRIKVFDAPLLISTDPVAKLNVQFQTLDLDRLGPGFPVKGDMKANFVVDGPFTSPKASLTAKASSLIAESFKIGDLDIFLAYEHGQLSIESAMLTNGKSQLSLSGSATIMEKGAQRINTDPDLNILIHSPGISLEDFYPDLSGFLVLDGSVSGKVNNPDALLNLTGTDIDILGKQRLDRIDLSASLKNQVALIPKVEVAVKPGEMITTTGSFSLKDFDYEINVMSEPIPFESLKALEGRFPEGSNLSVDLHGKGSLSNPDLQGRVKIAVPLPDRSIMDADVQVLYKNKKLNLSEADVLGFTGHLDTETLQFSAQAMVDQLNLAPFLSAMERQKIGGSLTASFNAQGNLDEIASIQAEAKIKSFSLFEDNMPLLFTENLDVFLDQDGIKIPGADVVLLEQGHLAIRCQASLEGNLEVDADGSIPLDVVHRFVSEFYPLQGDLGLSGSIRGSLEQPQILAEINLNNVGVEIPELMQKFEKINGRIRLTPDKVILGPIEGVAGAGEIECSGDIALVGFAPGHINFVVKAENLNLTVPGTMELPVDLQLTLNGKMDQSTLQGSVTTLGGQYYKEVELMLLKDLTARKRAKPVASETDTPEFLKGISLDVRIKAKDFFTVENRLALIAMKPDLKLYGTMAQPRLSGKAEVDSGVITFQGRELEVKKGIVDFINPYRIEPSIDIESQAVIRDWTIKMTVSGTPDELIVKLASDPSLEDADIISLLALGKTTAELGKSGDDSKVSTSQIIGDLVAASLAKDVKEATGMDVLEVSYQESSDENSSDGVDITVGKELSRRMTVKYGMEIKGGNTVQRASSEYKFFENLLMSTWQDTEGDYGAELIFRLEFR